MKLKSFRIKNFRSIVDTGWTNFSPDSVTVFVGQNESGKSAILEALDCAWGSRTLTQDDIRVNSPFPSIYLRMQSDINFFSEDFEDRCPEQREILSDYMEKHDGLLEIAFEWERETDESGVRKLKGRKYIDAPELHEELENAKPTLQEQPESTTTDSDGNEQQAGGTTDPTLNNELGDVKKLPPINVEELLDLIEGQAPYFTMFNQATGLLPDTIDIDANGRLQGNGRIAAINYLNVSGVKLKDLLEADERSKRQMLDRAKRIISRDFEEFWTQTIGRNKTRLELECDMSVYSNDNPEKVGQRYLVFLISDASNKVHPRQRSMGVRWFLSFFLQLRASEIQKEDHILLLDEPGANLHSRAQKDVLTLINKLRKQIPIVYSTHSAELIEFDKLYRIRAVQRLEGDDDDSPTQIIDAGHLASASTDALSPVLKAMGIDLSQQSVVKKENDLSPKFHPVGSRVL